MDYVKNRKEIIDLKEPESSSCNRFVDTQNIFASGCLLEDFFSRFRESL